MANMVKDRLERCKLNISNFWDKKAKNHEVMRNNEIEI